MRVSEITEAGASLLGQQVRIEGTFVFVGSRGYIVDSIDHRDDTSSGVLVSLDNLKRVASSRVPPSGGSKYYYLDAAIVQGKLQQSTDGDFKFECSQIDLFTMTKAGHQFVVVP